MKYSASKGKVRKIWNHAKIYTATMSTARADDQVVQGGVGVIVINKWASRVIDHGVDILGRWAWVKLAQVSQTSSDNLQSIGNSTIPINDMKPSYKEKLTNAAPVASHRTIQPPLMVVMLQQRLEQQDQYKE